MKKLRTQTASDIIRDGLGAELIDENGNVISEIFRCDSSHSVVVNTFNNDIELNIMNNFITYAMERLEPFEDGTPLINAENSSEIENTSPTMPLEPIR
jgi:hypothetical protein